MQIGKVASIENGLKHGCFSIGDEVHGFEARSRWMGRAACSEPMRVRYVGFFIDPVENILGIAGRQK